MINDYAITLCSQKELFIMTSSDSRSRLYSGIQGKGAYLYDNGEGHSPTTQIAMSRVKRDAIISSEDTPLPSEESMLSINSIDEPESMSRLHSKSEAESLRHGESRASLFDRDPAELRKKNTSSAVLIDKTQRKRGSISSTYSGVDGRVWTSHQQMLQRKNLREVILKAFLKRKHTMDMEFDVSFGKWMKVMFFVLGIVEGGGILHWILSLLMYSSSLVPLSMAIILYLSGEGNKHSMILYILAFGFCFFSVYTARKYLRTNHLRKLFLMSSEGLFGVTHGQANKMKVAQQVERRWIISFFASSLMMSAAWSLIMPVMNVTLFSHQSQYPIFWSYIHWRWIPETMSIFQFMAVMTMFNTVLRLHSVTIVHFKALVEQVTGTRLSSSSGYVSEQGDESLTSAGFPDKSDEFDRLASLPPYEQTFVFIEEHNVITRDLLQIGKDFESYWTVSFVVFSIGMMLGGWILLYAGLGSVQMFMDKGMAIAFPMGCLFGFYNILVAPQIVSNANGDLMLHSTCQTSLPHEFSLRLVQYLTTVPAAFCAYGLPITNAFIAKALYIMVAMFVFILSNDNLVGSLMK